MSIQTVPKDQVKRKRLDVAEDTTTSADSQMYGLMRIQWTGATRENLK